VEEHMA